MGSDRFWRALATRRAVRRDLAERGSAHDPAPGDQQKGGEQTSGSSDWGNDEARIPPGANL
jgi:hypothetical protein